jgi:hypothetical protein
LAIIVADSPPVKPPKLRLIRDEEAVPYDGRPPRREPFAMIPHRIADEYQAKAGPAGWSVLTALARFADADGRCFPSIARLCKQTGIASRDTVHRALDRLTDLGVVRRTSRHTDTGAATSNGYELAFLCLSDNQTPPTKKRTPPVQKTDTPCPIIGHELDVVNENQKNENGEYPPTPRRTSHVAYPADFEAWWERYPKGRGTKKVAAEKWRRLDAADRAAASAGLDAWLASDQWQRDGGRFVVWAERFLERRAWENDPPPPVPAPPSPNGHRNGYHQDDNRLRLGDLLQQIEARRGGTHDDR